MAEGDSELADLYRDVLLDYFRSRSRRGLMPHPDFRGHGVNPVCGDEVAIAATRRDGVIAQIRYEGHGCVISQASAALLAEALEGQTPEGALGLVEAFRGMLVRNTPAQVLPEALEDARAMEGVRKFPVRVKCALLAWNTFQLGLQESSDNGAAQHRETER